LKEQNCCSAKQILVGGAGLALAIVDGGPGVPAFLLTKRVLSLDMGLLIAGAKERGELELRVTRLLAETREAGDVILMCASSCPGPVYGQQSLPKNLLVRTEHLIT